MKVHVPDFQVNGGAVLQFLKYCLANGHNPADIKFNHSAIKNYFATVLRQTLASSTGYGPVPLFLSDMDRLLAKATPEQAKVLSAKEITVILRWYYEKKDRSPFEDLLVALLVWQLYTAHRADDMIYTEWKDITIDNVNKTIEVIVRDSKTGPAKSTFIAGSDPALSAFDVLQRYFAHFDEQERSGRIFKRWIPNSTNGKFSQQPIGKNQVSKLLQTLLEPVSHLLPDDVQWEIKHKVKHYSNEFSRIGLARYTGHSLRRSITTMLAANEKVSDTELQRLGRWTNPKAMERYKDNNAAVRINTQEKITEQLEREARRANNALAPAVHVSNPEAKASTHEDCMKLIDEQDEMDSMVTNVEETRIEIAQQEIAKRFVFSNCEVHINFK
jgi:integrase